MRFSGNDVLSSCSGVVSTGVVAAGAGVVATGAGVVATGAGVVATGAGVVATGVVAAGAGEVATGAGVVTSCLRNDVNSVQDTLAPPLHVEQPLLPTSGIPLHSVYAYTPSVVVSQASIAPIQSVPPISYFDHPWSMQGVRKNPLSVPRCADMSLSFMTLSSQVQLLPSITDNCFSSYSENTTNHGISSKIVVMKLGNRHNILAVPRPYIA